MADLSFDDLIPDGPSKGKAVAPAASAAPGDLSFDDLVPSARGDGSELRAYEPTWREQLASWFMGDSNSAERQRLVSGLLGSSGAASEKRVGVVDFTPASIPMFAQEAKRAAEAGQTGEAALNALGATPAPVLGKAISSVAAGGRKAIEAAMPLAEAAERAGVRLPAGLNSRAAEAIKEVPIPQVAGGNPVANAADEALNGIAVAADNASALAKKPLEAQVAIRDWLTKADEAAPVAPVAPVEAKIADEAAAPALGDQASFDGKLSRYISRMYAGSSNKSKEELAADFLKLSKRTDDPEAQAAVARVLGKAPASEPQAVANTAMQPGSDGLFRIVTPDNSMEIAAKPQVVELADLKFAAGDLQPRDRSRAEYMTDMLERANKLDPEQLRPSRVSDGGAPIVQADGTILSGNGRARSIAQVYSNPALADRAAAYKASLGPEAANMRQPVLIMRADGIAPDDAVRFADLSNRGRVASMSATERASRDARALGDSGVALYKGGDFESPENAQFLTHFMGKVATAGELPGLSKGGRLTQEGAQRMRNAVLAAAYEDSALLSRMLESTDDNIRNLTGALTDVAPMFAGLKADIRAGVVMPEMDATSEIVAAVKKIADLRNNNTTADRWFAQMDAFDDTDPIVKEWVRAFHTEDLARPISRQKMTEVLKAYADEAGKHAPGGLFEDLTTAGDVLNVARKAGYEEGAARTEQAGQAFSNGPRNVESGAQAQGQSLDRVLPQPSGTGAQAGDGAAQAARDGSEAQSLKRFLPREKTPAERSFEAKKAQLGDVLGIKGDVLPSKSFDRVYDLAKSGSPDSVEALFKARALMGDEAWRSVAGGVLGKMGLGADAAAFFKAWEALPAGGRNVLAGDARQSLDDVALLMGAAKPLKSLSTNQTRKLYESVRSVPIVGEVLGKALATKTGDAAAHAALGYGSLGTSTAAAIGAKALGTALMRPRSTKALSRWLAAYQALEKHGDKASGAFILASRSLSKALADNEGGK